MDAHVLFAGVPVSDFTRSRSWYELLFGRPPDVVAHEQEVMWQVTDGGWLYIVLDPARAGSTSVALAVAAVERVVAAAGERGVEAGAVAAQGDAGRKAVVRDPDGNTIAIVEVAGE